MFGATETLFSSTIPNFLKSGGIHLREKAIKTGGGITVYMKEGITYLHLNDLECDEIEAVWLEILVERGNSFLINHVLPHEHIKTLTKIYKHIINRSY